MSKLREIVTYENCFNKLDGQFKDSCQHFLAAGEEGTAEALFCGGCGCHRCCHRRSVTRVHEIDKTSAMVTYGKCLKNHGNQFAGLHSVDGCGEFVAAGEKGTPKALSCVACGCHRSFHEKEYL